MILELDCGNSFIKWRVITGPAATVVASGTVDSFSTLVRSVSRLSLGALQGGRAVSVRGADESAHLAECVLNELGIQLIFAQPATALNGVVNGYADYERLGLDRWLALVAAHTQAGRACLVLDLGTAITSDFVNANGEHLGGYICPGMPLMRSQLRTHTRRIRYEDAEARIALSGSSPGRSTAEAVERGCALMARSFVHSQVKIGFDQWGAAFDTFITGGDAGLVDGEVLGAHVVPDLIFQGLALACPLEY